MPAPAWVARRRFDVGDCRRMTEAGVLGRSERVELIAGEIIEMAAIGSPHIGAVMALTRLLVRAVRDGVELSIQMPLRLDAWNEPEPDLALLRPRADRYRREPPPSAAEALLVVEVADSSLRFDRQVKTPLYARHGVSELWIVDLVQGGVEVCRSPGADGYADTRRAGRDETISPAAFPDIRVPVAELLPP